MQAPKEVKFIIEKLEKNDFEAYIVGGCVRDLFRGVEPSDWDIATNARPAQIGKLFLKSFANNKFGTVVVVTGSKDETLKEVEITPYRIESRYTDKRHPDKIRWAKTIEEDLARRDFTVNAMAIELTNNKQQTTNNKSYLSSAVSCKVIDLFGGQDDLKEKIIKAVGNPEERFSEDALRLMRAIRFAVTLGSDWKIEKNTEKAIKENAHFLQMISQERIRDELTKIIMSERAANGIELLRELGLLKYIIPELEEGYRVSQNKHHIYDCYEHSLLSLKYAAKKNYNMYVRIGALLHDIGKPRTKQGEGLDATFYSHEIVGAKMAAQILNRLRYPKADTEKIVKLVRYHLFYYNVDEVGDASVRRLLRKVGSENIEELLQIRHCDRIGSGCPKAEPYKLRHLRYLMEKVSQDPISVTMLQVSGNDVMEILGIEPGPKVGQVLDILLGEALEDPKQNQSKKLLERIKELGKLSDKELQDLAKKARAERDKIEMKQDEMTKKKYWVT